jgi:hypothetical protein
LRRAARYLLRRRDQLLELALRLKNKTCNVNGLR